MYNPSPMDHDRLFKELLRTFFAEFLDLFLPDVAAYVDRDSITFLDKEVFTDVTAGERHEVDLLARARFRERDAFFLLHVENQAKPQEQFARRMFRYFARLHEQFDLPVYPIAIFSCDAPQRPEPDRYEVEFPDWTVLTFCFRVIQLNRLNWRDFARRPNPVAAALMALMAKMRIEPEDRPRVMLECLRLIATLRLNEAKQALIWGFMNSYLQLSAEEIVRYNVEAATPERSESEDAMGFIDQFEEIGVRNYILRLLRRRFGQIPPELEARLRQMPQAKLDELGDAFSEFAELADVEAWVARNG